MAETLAEVLVAHPAIPNLVDPAPFAGYRCPKCGVRINGSCNSPGHAEHQARAVTAHLAAILADPETVEAVAREFSGSAWPHNWESWADEARAVLEIIAARLGATP